MIFLDSVLDRIFIYIRNYARVCTNRSKIDDFLVRIIYEYLASKEENVVDCKSGMNQALNNSIHMVYMYIYYTYAHTQYTIIYTCYLNSKDYVLF